MTDAEYRDDAAVVYRYLRDHDGASVPEMTEYCFPHDHETCPPSGMGPGKLCVSVTRVLNALVWMRHQKVLITAVPGMVGLRLSTFHLGVRDFDPKTVSRSAGGFEGVEVVTDEVSQPEKAVFSDAMDLYHPK
jgi:hypothetical protein